MYKINTSAPPLMVTKRAAERGWELIQEARVKPLLQLWLLATRGGLYQAFGFQWGGLLQQELDLKIRVLVTGGGCHGLQYEFGFAWEVEPADTLISQALDSQSGSLEKTVAHFLISARSLQKLTGAEIDYQSDLQGERFIIRNIKAKTACSCGASFSIE